MTEPRFTKAEILLVDALCDQFEGAANRGEKPRIEDFLPKAPEEIQPRLFAELLQFEIAGDSKSNASCDTYVERFPQFAQIVRKNWPDAAEATITTPGSRNRRRTRHASTLNEPATANRNDGFVTNLMASKEAVARYSIIKTHAKGGLGEVFIAEDHDLHRRVAVKEIQPFAADDPESRARFLLEAEITGRLEHPGIVPVYSLGASAEGRPYYAMRFIQGESLKEAIEKHHANKSQTNSEKAFEFRQLLSRFVAVCQAVGFAHDRGILHRDLKPANIMLGKFGETLVVDWGLAKVLGKHSPGAEEVSALIPKGKDDSSETRHGAIVGTPAYMSPEQARGEIDELGPAADIYSLGATLYSIVTGERPVQGTSTAELLRNVRDGKTEVADRSFKGAQVPLLAICRKAMALETVDRYATALILAADVERWLADEPVSAHPENFTAKARRWLKRHTTAVSTISAALLVLIFALTGGGIALGFKNNELQEANGKHLRAKQAAEKAQKAAEKARRESDIARDAAQKAQKKSDVAKKAAEEAQAQADIARKAAEKSAKEEKEANAVAQARLAQLREHNLVLKDIFRDIDPNLGTSGGVTLSEQLAKRLIDASKRLTADSVDDAIYVADLQATLGNAIGNLGHMKEAIELHSKALEISLKAYGPEHAQTLTCMDNVANAYRENAQIAEAIPLFEKTLELRRKVLGPSHQDTLRTMNNLANGYESAGNLEKSLAMLETVVAINKNSLGESHADTVIAMSNLAGNYLNAGQYPKAVKMYEEIHAKWLAQHGAEHGLVIGAKANLGYALLHTKEYAKAVEILEPGIEAAKKTLGADHPTTLAAMNSCATALSGIGQFDRAIALQEETFAKKKIKLGPDHPGTLASMSGLASAHLAARHYEDAIRILDETLELKKRRYPEDHPEYMRTFSALGRANLGAKKFERAIEIYEKNLAIAQKKLGPDHPETLTEMHNLSLAKVRGGKYDQGRELIDSYLDKRRRALPLGDLKFTEMLWEFGNEVFASGKHAEAEKLLRECLALRKQYGKEPWRSFATQSLLGAALAEQQKHVEAEALLKEAYDGLVANAATIPKNLSKTIPNAASRLAKMYESQGKVEESQIWKQKETEASTEPKASSPAEPK